MVSRACASRLFLTQLIISFTHITYRDGTYVLIRSIHLHRTTLLVLLTANATGYGMSMLYLFETTHPITQTGPAHLHHQLKKYSLLR